jgi:TPR repeat protein
VPAENNILVEGFVAAPKDPSGLRFPDIERAAAKVFPPESGCIVTIRNPMRGGSAELCVVTSDGSCHSALFALTGLATAAAGDLEQWWEDAIGAAWEGVQREERSAALSKVRRLAEEGDANAQFELGEAYYEGRGLPRDYAEALDWFRKAAAQSHLYANSNLGDIYEKGEGIPANRAEAVRYYLAAADIAFASLDSDELLNWDPDACSGAIGQGAEYGHARAQRYVGHLYATGDESLRLRQDYTEAAKWYRRAAEQGLAPAQYDLGRMYADGQGVPQDYVLAHMWLNLAGAAGEAEAIRHRDAVASNMTRSQIADAQRLARERRPGI